MSPPYLVDELHVTIMPGGAVWLVQYENIVDSRLVSLPARCADCNEGPPETIEPPPGFDAAFLVVHQPSCPAFNSALHDGEPS